DSTMCGYQKSSTTPYTKSFCDAETPSQMTPRRRFGNVYGGHSSRKVFTKMQKRLRWLSAHQASGLSARSMTPTVENSSDHIPMVSKSRYLQGIQCAKLLWSVY